MILFRNEKSKAVLGILTTLFSSTALFAVGPSQVQEANSGFQYISENLGENRILRYSAPDFEGLSLRQKKLLYFLSQAGNSGRDIIWDQHFKHGLTIRRTLEEIVKRFPGDRSTSEFGDFMTFVKEVWISNGIHHHASCDKLTPKFSPEYFAQLILDTKDAQYPLSNGETSEQLMSRLMPLLFDPNVATKSVCSNPKVDIVANSSVNFYDGGLTELEVDNYYNSVIDAKNETPISYGLNTKKVKRAGTVVEEAYSTQGLYRESILEIVKWLGLATTVAENDKQRLVIEKLIEFFQTGDLKKFDEYNILWVQDTESTIDFNIGFIEVYGDPKAHTGSYESVVYYRDPDATAKFGVIAKNAQWFEDHSPTLPQHKKKAVTGISYNVINVISEAGDSSPITPIGINLPNTEWIREKHGSKSISLTNIEHAYAQASASSGVLDEFYLPEIQEAIRKYGTIEDKIHTGLHEVVGHASGIVEPGVGNPADTFGLYHNTLEEGRADLVGLYYMGDQKLVDMGVSPTTEIVKSSYTTYITNGLLRQYVRIKPGKNLEEAHMRNRQLISKWVFELSQKEAAENHTTPAVERKDIPTADGISTYFVINDYQKMREYFGRLLKEIQRIKSQGDVEAAKALVETYAVKIDPEMHAQVLRRWKKLKLPAYSAFINPTLTAVYDGSGEISDVKVGFEESFEQQMLRYGADYSTLPNYPSAK